MYYSAPRHQQYRGQHPQTRDNRYINQPPRHPSPISGQQGPSPSASPSAVPPQPPTALGTGGPHDMNKQGAPNRPALTPSPVQQGQILPGQQVLINPINPQTGQIMYQQNMPRHQQTMYVPIQAGQRGNPRAPIPMNNMPQMQQGGQAQATFQTNTGMTMAAPPFIPSSHHGGQQQAAQYMMPQVMMANTQMYAPRQQMPSLQYQHPTAVFQQPNTPPFYSRSSPVSAGTGAFFPQNQTLVATQPQQLRAQNPSMLQQPQQRLPQRERKVIRIVDPTTNSDITDSIMRDSQAASSTGTTPTHSGRSSASSTPPAVSSGPPPPTQQNQQLNDKARAIQASFAAQVALAAAGDTNTSTVSKAPSQVNQQTNNSQQQQPPSQPPPQQQQQPRIVHNLQAVRMAAPQQGTVAVAAAPVASAAPTKLPEVQPSVIVDPVGATVPITIASQVQKQAPLPIRPSEVTPAPTQISKTHTTPIPAPVPAPAVPKQATDSKPSQEAESNSAEATDSKKSDAKGSKEKKTTKGEDTPDKGVEEKPAESDVKSAEKSDSKPKEEAPASKEDTSAVKEEPASEKLPEKEAPKTEKPVETAKQEPESKSLPQEKTAEKPSLSAKEFVPQKEIPSEAKQVWKNIMPSKKRRSRSASSSRSRSKTRETTSNGVPAKENKKKNQKKRLAELDKKATKTDDLEAYKDKDASESAPVPSEKKPEVKEDATPAPEKPKPEQKAPEKAPAPAAEEEPKTELSTTTKTDEKESKRAEPESENEKLSSNEKDIPKVEVSVVDSVDKKDREKVEAENAKNKESMDNEDDSNKPAPKDNKIQLKYTYRDDRQWSPVNPEGKKQYGRDFLLQFQPECKDKPDGLPHIPDIVLDKAEVRPIAGVADPRLQPQRGGGGRGGVDFMPEFMRSPRGSGQAPQFPQAGGRRSSRETRKVIARDSRGPDVSLKKAENAWKPGSKKEEKAKNLSEEEVKTEELIKTFKSILNKLTPQNFQKLMAKTLQLPIDNEERLTAIIDLVFEKAITESAFSKAYANMCRVLSQIKVPAANASGLVQFRTVLINRCQRAFEAEKKDEGTFAEMKKEIEKLELGSEVRTTKEEELFILQVKAKQKVLGNMRFIGELFKLHMLTEPIMHDCIFKLLRAKDDESLECMSQLLKTVGKDLDHERAKNRMDQYFNQMAKIIGNKKMSSRIRFMLQDVQDLRRSNWIPRRDDNNPKTIAQIHQEAKQEEQQKKIETQMNIQHHATKSKEKSRGGRPAPPSPGDDWQTVTATNKGRPQIDPSKLINLGRNRQPETDNVQLGPGGRPGAFGSWGRGSSGGGAKMQSSDQVDLRPSGNNRFSILSGSDRGARPGMGPPTRDSKGRPTGTVPARRSREDDRRGGSREENQRRERQKLLDEVSRGVGQGGARSRSSEKDRRSSRERGGGSRGSREGGSRDRGSRERGARDSRERATPSPTMGKPKAPAMPELSDEEYETKGRATLDEYLNIRDMKEACQCLSEMSSPERMHMFVRLSIEHVLEMDAKSRLATGTLFHRLIRENILSVQQYLQGLNEVLEFADDMAIDIPLIWQYLGEVMGSMIQDKEQSIEYLGKALEPVKAADKGGVLLAEILRTAEKNIGAEDLNYLWQSAGFTWEQFLPSDENVLEFVRSKKLEYTLQKSKTDPLALMVKELTFMLARKEKLDNDNVFDWIKKNIDPELTKQKDFIRALVTVVCQSTIEGESSSIRCDPELLKVRAKCLLRYIDGDQDKELQALFAVQALNHKLVNPPGFLRIIFDVLYDEDVISEETFYAWQNSKDPAEQNGKGVALKSVTSFFAWLGEAEEEAPN